ncbi:tRNA (guanosine(37)-N1)-methyltransferase TrmD [Cellulomonas wangsupingiae]|uniref:tRNA (guanine-N(1)-)-methyltransferase n=1 Tax=Cellulomonas wangsupingiae TaxID=2968085 RepID=A0ABY5KAU1_9CELL|nr:tRNA (guanosine(37)-N1)-methyltransferase TrmD [Cellulomonas wangsupingiae]MCC2335312.1 tRNA (guanosine(37)-N1)-methyltransferase TrmD [Cellulomonas wangsupingiae]UUI66551.1 tRNA (guanosine(37)-N1)-methyltransferase TrmD [Cellulomonas wangsupingiae]
MRVDVVSIFPEYLAPLELSLVGKARAAGLLDLRVHDLRAWTDDRHRTVDDTPFGGGAGMVMRPDVWGRALDDVLTPEAHLLVPSPAGAPFTQRTAEALALEEHLVVACGRYEGIDARVAEHYASRGRVTEVSLGDYVLNGGEVAALVVVEAVARLLPGVVGNPASLVEESHGAAGLLEYPVYTKPASWQGHDVPDVLLSGHHARIERWRRDEALRRTADRRPDLLADLDVAQLDRHDRQVLAASGWEVVDGRLCRVPAIRSADGPVAD